MPPVTLTIRFKNTPTEAPWATATQTFGREPQVGDYVRLGTDSWHRVAAIEHADGTIIPYLLPAHPPGRPDAD